MQTQAEYLPKELWLSIFSYLKAHDLFTAFTNLNRRFDQLLASDYLTFYVQLEKQVNRYIQCPAIPRWLDGILNRIVCLQLTSQSEREYVPDYLHRNAHQFIRLQSLIITINTHQTKLICQILKKLHSLEYLSITCKTMPILIKTILSISTLRVFQLTVMDIIYFFDYHFNVKSNIETFYINFPILFDYQFMNFLLTNMPKLKRFEIFGDKYRCWKPDELFYGQILNLSALRTIKFQGGVRNLSSIFYEHLQMKVPALRELHMDIYYVIIDEKMFYNLIYSRWTILENLEKVRINITGIYLRTIVSKRMNNYRKTLLAKNNKVNDSFKIKWIEHPKDFSATLVIEKTKMNR
ncbi:unnamed protein product [Rotaria sp. Silwood1]|nr:unnamed protein product [Rotaria sp. Silwood1]CAF1627082.1 unnamed protein product [Rotaria sp. Silwood1]CAF3772902.1 unnamed protein product [Rotaria sp. Silwood1]CAF3912476.1 unnamed protein product [Rotaria sp. Silwood1]CAF5027930.1 unnamed protein product [Rotaria sp. Silwood1]